MKKITKILSLIALTMIFALITSSCKDETSPNLDPSGDDSSSAATSSSSSAVSSSSSTSTSSSSGGTSSSSSSTSSSGGVVGLQYFVDCGEPDVAGNANRYHLDAGNGEVVGAYQSHTADKQYGLDGSTGKSWGHVGNAGYSETGFNASPSPQNYWMAWCNNTDARWSIINGDGTTNNIIYRFDVDAGGDYYVTFGLHDSWNEGGTTSRAAEIRINGVLMTTHYYAADDYNAQWYDVTAASSVMEITLVRVTEGPLLDMIKVERYQ